LDIIELFTIINMFGRNKQRGPQFAPNPALDKDFNLL